MQGGRAKLVSRIAMVFAAALFVGAATAQAPRNDGVAESRKSQAPQRPNIIIILADDLGYGDVGFNGNGIVETPILDQLARESVTLTQFHVSAVCSPTRASLLTGRHSLRTGVWSVTRGGETMRADEVTLAEALGPAGYRTALFGKWHNGSHYPHDPIGQGFQKFTGFLGGHSNSWDPVLVENGKPRSFPGYLPDIITDEAVGFIDAPSDQPFFLYLPFNSPHSPFEAPQSLFAKYKAKGADDIEASVYSMTENLDANVGRILEALRRAEKDQNTIVIFMSDNGPAFPGGSRRYNHGLKGWKGSLDEGGTRVPFILRWPAGLQGGRALSLPAQHIDILPTLLELAAVKRRQGPPLDGASLAALLKGGQAPEGLSSRKLFTHHFRNTQRPDEIAIMPAPGSVRQGDYLAVQESDGKWRLYNLAVDPSQSFDIAQKNAAKTAELASAYREWFQSVSRGALHPVPVELGHDEAPSVTLEAHEASLFGTGISYRGGYGWTHDWVTDWKSAAAYMQWPIQVVREGKYEATLIYAADDRQGGMVELSLGKARLTGRLAPQSRPPDDWGRRLYFTDEAPNRKWDELKLGTFKIGRDGKRLILRAAPSGAAGLGDIKAIRLERLNK